MKWKMAVCIFGGAMTYMVYTGEAVDMGCKWAIMGRCMTTERGKLLGCRRVEFGEAKRSGRC